jgi:transcriptional regulator with XRE-family HTH domain
VKEANLGETLRRLRRVARLSLRALAEKTGFSASFLSQVENGLASPSLASMERIALALGMTMGQIFEGAERPKSPSVITRVEARVALKSDWSKARLEALNVPAPGGRLEPVMLIMAPGGTTGARAFSSTREEFAFVMEGTVMLSLEDPEAGEGAAQEHELHRGDSVTIRAGGARRWQNQGDRAVQILIVSAR